jgi:GNAT superfamily N-acetyltransferase
MVDLRRATADDADACVAVQRASSVVGYAHIFDQSEYPFPDDAVRQEWVDRLAGPTVVTIASVDGAPVGVVGARNDRLESLFVVPEHWGGQVASILHDEALALIAATGAEAAVLDVLADNLRARRFYERRGWTQVRDAWPSPWPPHPLIVGYRRAITEADRRRSPLAASRPGPR